MNFDPGVAEPVTPREAPVATPGMPSHLQPLENPKPAAPWFGPVPTVSQQERMAQPEEEVPDWKRDPYGVFRR
jgi:hypothetical protein